MTRKAKRAAALTVDSEIPALTRIIQQIENDASLDTAAEKLRPYAERLISDPARRDLLLGKSLGHALHPLMTDMPIGFWTSALTIDFLGPRGSERAARRLIGLGILASLPTALTGLAEWSGLRGPDARVGVAHAAGNSAALTAFILSYCARRRGHHKFGKLLGLTGGAALTFSGYLGGHLAIGQKIGTSTTNA